jgi:PRC-barrel domain
MVQSDIATDETSRLIASNKVEGTAVYNAQQEKLGSIHNFMVDKISGRVEYAVLSFGGLFGLGTDFIRCPGTC